MKKLVIHQQERGERIINFADNPNNEQDFQAADAVAALTIIRAQVTKLQALPEVQKISGDAAHGATGTMRNLRQKFLKDMRSLRRTLEQIKKKDSSIAANLEPPADQKDATILAAAAAYVTILTPLKAKFIARGKKATFLDALTDDIALFNQLQTAQQTGTAGREDAVGDISTTVEKLIAAIEDLNDIMENVYEDDPIKLAQWRRAEKLGTIARNPGAAQNSTPTGP